MKTNGNVPKYLVIKQELLRRITGGTYPARAVLPSEHEMMRRWGVSSITVRRVKQELVKEGKAYAIQGKGWFVAPAAGVKAAAGPAHGTNGSRRVVLIATHLNSEFFAPYIQGVVDVFQPRGFRVELYGSNGKEREEDQLLAGCIANRPAGILFNPGAYNREYRHLVKLLAAGTPVVLTGGPVSGAALDLVETDDRNGIKDAVKHLAKLGHKRIAFLGVGNPARVWFIRRRHDAFLVMMNRYGLPVEPGLVLLGSEKKEQSGDDYGQVQRFLRANRGGFTAIVAVNDSAALAAVAALQEQGVRVPQDVSITGYDDIQEAAFGRVPLTTLHVDRYRLGYGAAKCLFLRLSGRRPPARSVVIRPSLIVRASTAIPGKE